MASNPKSSLVSIGNFDGVHKGHQALLSDAARQARVRGLECIVLTFDPHPTVAVGRCPPACLTACDRKVRLIEAIDPGLRVVVQQFDQTFARQTPEEFVRNVLLGQLNAQAVRVGENFRFGAARNGDVTALRQIGVRVGLGVETTPLAGDAQGRYSSTRIRRAVQLGQLESAEGELGRPHSVSGVVVTGQKLAREMGFPTANLGWVGEMLVPHGVYAVAVDRIADSGEARRIGLGVASIGVRPTVDAGFAVEVHLFDFDDDLYGARLRVHILTLLRGEAKFSGIAELREQIVRDVAQGRRSVRGLALDANDQRGWY